MEPVTLVEAAREGWWYSAPLPNDTGVFAFMTDSGGDAAHAATSAALWDRCIDAAPYTRARFRAVVQVGPALARATGPGWTEWPTRPDFLPSPRSLSRSPVAHGTARRGSPDAVRTREAFIERLARFDRVVAEASMEVYGVTSSGSSSAPGTEATRTTSTST